MKTMNQIPRSDESVNRRSKESLLNRSDSMKKPKKIVGKMLNSAFFAVSEDLPLEANAAVDYSTESEVTSLSESVLLSPDLKTSSVKSGTASLSSSNNFTEEKEIEVTLVEINRSEKLEENIDGQIFLDFLQEARVQVSKTSDVDLRSKKIVDAVMKILMEDFSFLPEYQNKSTSLASEKVRLGSLCFLVWSLTALMILCFSNIRARNFGLPPT